MSKDHIVLLCVEFLENSAFHARLRFFKELVETVYSPLGDVMATDIYLLMQSLSFNVKLTNTLIATTDAYGFRITQNWKS